VRRRERCWLGRLDNRIQRAFFPSTFYSARPMISTSKNSFSLFLPLRSLKNNKFPFPIFLWRTAPLSLFLRSPSRAHLKRGWRRLETRKKSLGAVIRMESRKARSKSCCCCCAAHREKKKRTRVRLTASTQRLSLGRLNKLIDSSLASQLMSQLK
jgi:hypothetical protein